MTADDDDFLLLAAYCDGELSPGEAIDMERRLAQDPALRAMAEQLGALSGALHGVLATPPAPPGLRARIVERLGGIDAGPRFRWSSWSAIAAVLLIGLVGGGLIGRGTADLGNAPRAERTVDAVLAGHLRGLVAPEPFDIASSNRHVVKPWFNGRTTIAPDAPDLADKGFPLAGGRIDIVMGQPVPTLVYKSDRHVISVTIAPKQADAPAGEEHRDGTHIEHWNAGDLTYWALSDLNGKDLRKFVELFRAQVAQ